MERLIEIVKGTKACMTHVCEGKVFYQIKTGKHLYQLELDSCDPDWRATYLMPEFKAIHLLRWIRKGIEDEDGCLIKLT